jgi:hypothetical protein
VIDWTGEVVISCPVPVLFSVRVGIHRVRFPPEVIVLAGVCCVERWQDRGMLDR